MNKPDRPRKTDQVAKESRLEAPRASDSQFGWATSQTNKASRDTNDASNFVPEFALFPNANVIGPFEFVTNNTAQAADSGYVNPPVPSESEEDLSLPAKATNVSSESAVKDVDTYDSASEASTAIRLDTAAEPSPDDPDDWAAEHSEERMVFVMNRCKNCRAIYRFRIAENLQFACRECGELCVAKISMFKKIKRWLMTRRKSRTED